MVRVALLSRVTFSTVTSINRYCFDIYTHFSLLLRGPAVRFAWGGKRPPEYYYSQPNPLSYSMSEPSKASPWRGRYDDYACPVGTVPEAGVHAARRTNSALPDPNLDSTSYAIPTT